MEVLLKYLPITGLLFNTLGVIILALYSTPKFVLDENGSQIYRVKAEPDIEVKGFKN